MAELADKEEGSVESVLTRMKVDWRHCTGNISEKLVYNLQMPANRNQDLVFEEIQTLQHSKYHLKKEEDLKISKTATVRTRSIHEC